MAKTKTATTKPSKSNGNGKKTATTTATTPQVTGSQEAYETFLPDAQAIARGDVLVCRADPSLAYHNVDAGCAAVLAEKARIAKELPTVDVAAIASMPSLALAVAFAGTQVDREKKSDGAIAAKLALALPLRRKLLTSASALAEAAVVPVAEVAKIHKGVGNIDAAADLVALAALFDKHAKAIAGKSPITNDDVKQASALGTELLATLKPAAAKKNGARPGAEAADARDRLWTLLVGRHDVLRRVGAWLFGERALDAKVPALLAHASTSKKQKQATTTPTSTPTTGKTATTTPS